MKWTGPAQWTKREARAGDRLPFDRHIDDATIRLRDGAVMRTLHIGGMEFETQDADQLDHAHAVREVLLRSVLDARFVLYHHVVRRRVTVASGGEFESPFCAAHRQAVGRAAGGRRLFVNDQFLTLVRRPARGKTGWPERLQRRFGRRRARTIPARSAISKRRTASLLAGLEPYGARLLSCYRDGGGRTVGACSSSSRSSTMARCARSSCPRTAPTSASMLPYKRVSFGLDAMETARRRRPQLRRACSRSRTIPTRHAPGPDRRHPAPAVRAGADRELRAGRPPDRARADGPRAPPPEGGRRG